MKKEKETKEKIKVVITESDMYDAYAENVEGIYGMGNSIKEVKEDILLSISEFKKLNTPENIPDILKGDITEKDIEWEIEDDD